MSLLASAQKKRPAGAAAAVPIPSPNNQGRLLKGTQPAQSPTKPEGAQMAKAASTIPTGQAPGLLAANPQAQQALMPSTRASQIAQKGGALFDRAAHQGRAFANQRGLLNSSIAAGAASAAVVDRAAQLAQADVTADFQQQQLDLQKRDMDFKNNLDQRRLELDENYRQKALAQQAELDRERQALEVSMQERQIGVTKRGQDIGKEVSFAQMNLQERLGFGELDVKRDAQDLSERLGLGQLAVDEKRIAVDEAIRRQQLELDRDRFHSDDAYRDQQLQIQEGLAELKKEVDRGQLSLAQKQQEMESDRLEFYKALDRERFDSDEAYRQKALEQQGAIAQRNADLQMERIGLDRQGLALQERQGAANLILGFAQKREQAIAASLAQFPPGTDKDVIKAHVDQIIARSNAEVDDAAAIYGFEAIAANAPKVPEPEPTTEPEPEPTPAGGE